MLASQIQAQTAEYGARWSSGRGAEHLPHAVARVGEQHVILERGFADPFEAVTVRGFQLSARGGKLVAELGLLFGGALDALAVELA
jgi:hypothetical protein